MPLPSNWRQVLQGCNFMEARDDVERAFAMAAAEARERGGRYAYPTEAVVAWERFAANSCYETAAVLLEAAPWLWAVFEYDCRTGFLRLVPAGSEPCRQQEGGGTVNARKTVCLSKGRDLEKFDFQIGDCLALMIGDDPPIPHPRHQGVVVEGECDYEEHGEGTYRILQQRYKLKGHRDWYDRWALIKLDQTECD